MLKYASLTLQRGYNIEKGRGGREVKIWDWKTHAFNETGLFRGVSQLLLSMIVAFLGHTDSALPAHLFSSLSHEKSSNIQVVPLTFLL